MARDRYAAAKEAASPIAHEAAEAARERLQAAREAATEAAHEAADRMAPKVEAAQVNLRDNLLPRVGAAMTAAATAFAAGAEQAKESAGPRVEQAQKVAHLSGDRAKGRLQRAQG